MTMRSLCLSARAEFDIERIMQTAGMKARGAFFVSLCAIAAFPALGHSQVAAPVTQTASTGRDASIAEYRQHLQTLTTIVNACAKARDTKTCDPALVGPDDRVPLGEGAQAERRLIRYDW